LPPMGRKAPCAAGARSNFCSWVAVRSSGRNRGSISAPRSTPLKSTSSRPPLSPARSAEWGSSTPPRGRSVPIPRRGRSLTQASPSPFRPPPLRASTTPLPKGRRCFWPGTRWGRCRLWRRGISGEVHCLLEGAEWGWPILRLQPCPGARRRKRPRVDLLAVILEQLADAGASASLSPCVLGRACLGPLPVERSRPTLLDMESTTSSGTLIENSSTRTFERVRVQGGSSEPMPWGSSLGSSFTSPRCCRSTSCSESGPSCREQSSWGNKWGKGCESASGQ